MIELHIHLDGSLEPEEIITLAGITDVALPTYDTQKLRGLLTVPKGCKSLSEYLERFDLPLSVLQTPEAVRQAVRMLALRLSSQGIIYAEIRFAPQLHTSRGASQAEIALAAAEGARLAEAECDSHFNLILCCMRGADEKTNLETVYAASTLLNSGVCAIDLAGNEAAFKTHEYRVLFEVASSLKVPFTIHAGEADGAKSIMQAINFGAKRIGHGIRAYQDPEVLEAIKTRSILLENCYTSNIQTCAIAEGKAYPFAYYIKNGIPATVCTDNSTVSGTTLKSEYLKLKHDLSLCDNDLLSAALNAANGAFVDEEARQTLVQKVNSVFLNWLNN